ncbi:amidohydrolase family protein [Escherichia coli]|uniref:amidohydrolase family protein n=1 Tax=Escherichia coli TaxID=562 RepID=UPI0019C4CDC8|nr:amidohydrolase family protein [Escherichia coli]HAV7957450.1 amidohydrolase family protein [Escherichia coli]HCB2677110.1 amidohydrolase family protein [Escherichia coli]HCB2684251.1 amidohydrolase family protein [Escherichia coli]HCB2688798.1 amidohydrolase family protein [Escherichia coli]
MKKSNEVIDHEEELKELKIIDAHHHLWDLNKNYYPWLANYDPNTFAGDYRPLMRNYYPEDYRNDSCGLNILATVHCEADHDYTCEVKETAWVHEQAKRAGFPNAVIAHIWFHKENSEEILKQHLEFPLVRGIRSKPVTASSPKLKNTVKGVSGSMQDDKWLKGFSLLSKYNLSWDLRVPYWHLDEAAEVAKAFPHTPIVLNHLGFPWDRSDEGLSVWRKGMQALADCKNVHVKVSELCVRNQPWTIESNMPVIKETIDMFGIERCMFASNFPVASLKINYKTLVKNLLVILSDMTNEDREKFFWMNAKKFYRI